MDGEQDWEGVGIDFGKGRSSAGLRHWLIGVNEAHVPKVHRCWLLHRSRGNPDICLFKLVSGQR
jgi:hypothetical protein